MIKITLKDGSVKEFENAVSAADITKEISMGLYRNACSCKIGFTGGSFKARAEC